VPVISAGQVNVSAPVPAVLSWKLLPWNPDPLVELDYVRVEQKIESGLIAPR